jgi:glycerol uptake facilitator protein
MNLLKRSLAELVGTMLLVLVGCGSVCILLMLAAGTAPPNEFGIGIGTFGGLGDWLAVGVAFGLIVSAIIYALGGISGAHINPAVSIALWATKKFPTKDAGAYVIAQFVGAFIGSALFFLIAGPNSLAIGGLGATAPFPGISIWQAALAEIIGTFILMLIIMGSAVDKRASPGFAGLAIGMTVAAVILAIGNISGGSINPARSFGPDMMALIVNGSPALITTYPLYLIAPIIGAVLAAFFYNYIAELDAA